MTEKELNDIEFGLGGLDWELDKAKVNCKSKADLILIKILKSMSKRMHKVIAEQRDKKVYLVRFQKSPYVEEGFHYFKELGKGVCMFCLKCEATQYKSKEDALTASQLTSYETVIEEAYL